MINQIVQVIAPRQLAINSQNNVVELNQPHLGPDIAVGGARRILKESQWAVGVPLKFWWIASVHAENAQALIDWNNVPGNIGWISRVWRGANQAPNDSTANKIWAHIRSIIIAETPGGHNLWWVSGILPGGDPDMDDPVIQPTISAHKIHIDLFRFSDRAGLWSGTSSATNPQLNAWKADHNDLGWKDSLPVLGSIEGRILVRKIAQLANNSSKFQGE